MLLSKKFSSQNIWLDFAQKFFKSKYLVWFCPKIFQAKIFGLILPKKFSSQNIWLDFAQKFFKPKLGLISSQYLAWFCRKLFQVKIVALIAYENVCLQKCLLNSIKKFPVSIRMLLICGESLALSRWRTRPRANVGHRSTTLAPGSSATDNR